MSGDVTALFEATERVTIRLAEAIGTLNDLYKKLDERVTKLEDKE